MIKNCRLANLLSTISQTFNIINGIGSLLPYDKIPWALENCNILFKGTLSAGKTLDKKIEIIKYFVI